MANDNPTGLSCGISLCAFICACITTYALLRYYEVSDWVTWVLAFIVGDVVLTPVWFGVFTIVFLAGSLFVMAAASFADGWNDEGAP